MNTQSLLQPNINYNESTADEFSVTKAYSTGNYCIYNNILYKFTSDKAAGAWDSSKVTSTTVAGELSTLNTNKASKTEVVRSWSGEYGVKQISIDWVNNVGYVLNVAGWLAGEKEQSFYISLTERS